MIVEPLAQEETPPLLCRFCQSALKDSDRFCGTCGKATQVQEIVSVNEDIFSTIAPTLIFYFGNLVLLGIYKLTEVFDEGLKGVVEVSVIDIAMVMVFVFYYRKSIWPLFSLRTLRVEVIATTLAVAVLSAFVVNLIANLINVSLFEEVVQEIDFTAELAHPFVWSTILICVQPALFEEVTFRGFLFNNVSQVTNATGTILITSFMFGFLHLSFIGLLWLVPLGIAAAWLRSKYNTLWYGMVAHFTYNFTITCIEFFSV